MNIYFSVVYNDLRYSSRRTNNLTSIVCEILQNKNIVIFLIIVVDRGFWLSSRRTRSLFTIEIYKIYSILV